MSWRDTARIAPLLFCLTAVVATPAAQEPKTVTSDKAADQTKADADRSALALANTTFGLDLYAHLRRGPGNVFFSPLSLSTAALAMTAAGRTWRDRPSRCRQRDSLPVPGGPHRSGVRVAHSGRSGLPARNPAYPAPHCQRPLGAAGDTPFCPSSGRPFETSSARPSRGGRLPGSDTEAARQSINTWVEKQTARTRSRT